MRSRFFRWFGAAKGRGSGFSLMSVGNLLAALLTYARQAEIARIFGANWLTDTFAVALVFPMLVREVIAHSVGATFLPVYSDVRMNKGPEAAQRLVSRILTWTAIVGLTISALLVILRGPLVGMSAPGLSHEAKDLATTMLIVMVPILVLSSMSGVLQGICDFERRYGLTAMLRLGEVVVSYGVILLFSGSMGIMSLPVSVLAGAVAMFLLLMVITWHLRYRFSPLLDPVEPDFLRIVRNTLPVVAGATMGLLAPIVDKVLASLLLESSVTALDYAGKIVKMIFAILLMPLITLTNVQLSSLSARNDMKAFTREFRTMLNWNSAMMVPGSMVLAVLAVPMVSVLFQRGQFTLWDTRLVGWALLFYAPWLATFSTNSILNRAFFALGDTMTPVLISVWGMLVNVLLNVILMVPMGIGGLALATSVASLGKTVLMMYFLRKKTGPISGRAIAMEHVRIFLSTGLMALCIVLVGKRLPFDITADTATRALPVVIGLVSGSVVYGASMLLLRSEVVRSVIERLRPGRLS
jgi:putative peptidoglycan lipid II flippase